MCVCACVRACVRERVLRDQMLDKSQISTRNSSSSRVFYGQIWDQLI